MEIKQTSVAGTLESSDIMITVKPAEERKIILESSVEKQFGQQIRNLINQTLDRLQVTNVNVIAQDKGALDCTIQARLVTALHRASGEESYDWKEIDSWKD